ncbi:augmin complex subunit msd1-like [Drosophila serrata]|uniref:augmin complex subunit msd1-like n=1 Tax=Drosophila serrata TaxID=7274 RepID=UPI000A1D2B7C|nr:augmin complex subunit msd1-like [Drosophila serrata]
MPDAADQMLAGLAARRRSLAKQISKIDEIMERSNNTLLHIESNNKALAQNASAQESQKVYNLKPECELAVVRILQNFRQLMQSSDQREDTGSALDGCLAYRHRVEHLGSSVRKLVALCDTVNQMRSFQAEQEAQEFGDVSP